MSLVGCRLQAGRRGGFGTQTRCPHGFPAYVANQAGAGELVATVVRRRFPCSRKALRFPRLYCRCSPTAPPRSMRSYPS
jgi:hypothetical protein